MKKCLLFAFFFGVFLFFPISDASAQLRMTTAAPVAETANAEAAPVVVQDGRGDIHAFASHLDNDVIPKSKLYWSTYNGSSFSAPTDMSSLLSWTGGVRQVSAVKESGGAVSLVIERKIPSTGVENTELFWTRNDGTGWSNPITPPGVLAKKLTNYYDRDTQPTLVALGSGKLGLVFSRWIAYDASGNPLGSYDPATLGSLGGHIDYDLYQMTYDPAISDPALRWSDAEAIATTPFISEAYPTLAQGPGGKLFLFYSTNQEGNWTLVWRKFESGVWGAPSILESGLMEQYLQQPSIINDVPGKYRLVYAQKKFCPNVNCPNATDGFSSEIRYRTYDSVTNIWADPVSVTDASQFYADQPSAIWDSNGTYWMLFRYFNQTNFGGSSTLNGNTDIYWMKSQANTPVGTNVQVDLGYGSNMTFANVTGEGNSTLDTSSTNPGDVSGVFKIGNFFYDVNTNATWTGTVTISLKYADTGMTQQQEESLRMLHWLTGPNRWEDATVSVDTVNNILTGQVTSLSWIAVASGPVIDWKGPIINIKDGEVYTLNDGSTLPIKFSFKNSNGNYVRDENVSVVVSGNGGSRRFVIGTGDDNVRYDSTTGEYIVNLHTKSFVWIVPGQSYEIKVANTYTGDEGWTTNFTVLDGGKAQGKK